MEMLAETLDADFQPEEIEFFVTKPSTGWTADDDQIFEAALDLAGMMEAAQRWTAAGRVSVADRLAISSLTHRVEMDIAALKAIFDRACGAA